MYVSIIVLNNFNINQFILKLNPKHMHQNIHQQQINQITSLPQTQITKILNDFKKVQALKDKAVFFEGQFNPLYNQNLILKQEIINLKKQLAQKTDKLRNLLNHQDRSGKNRKVMIETGDLDEIIQLIKIDWNDMNKQNQQLQKEIQVYACKINLLVDQEQKLKNQHNEKIKEVLMLIETNQIKHQQQIKQVNIQKELEIKKSEIVIKSKDKLLHSKQMELEEEKKKYSDLEQLLKSKSQQYENMLKKLNFDINNLVTQFDEYRRGIQTVYGKQMKERLELLKNQYENKLKNKELQKQNLLEEHDKAIFKMNEKYRIKNQEVKKLKTDLTNLNKQLDQNKEQYTKLKNLKQQIQLKYNQADLELQRVLKQQKQNQQMINQLNSKVDQLKQQVIQYKQFKEKSEEQINTLKQILKMEQSDAEKKLRQLLESQQQEMKKLKQNYVEKSMYDNLMDKASRLQKKIEEKMEQLRKIEKKYEEELIMKNEQFEKKMARLQQQEQKRRQEMQNAYNDQIKTLQENRQNEISKLIEQNKSNINQMNKKIKKIIEQNQAKLEILQQNHRAEQKKFLNVIKKLQEQKQEFQNQKKIFQRTIKTLNRKIEEQNLNFNQIIAQQRQNINKKLQQMLKEQINRQEQQKKIEQKKKFKNNLRRKNSSHPSQDDQRKSFKDLLQQNQQNLIKRGMRKKRKNSNELDDDLLNSSSGYYDREAFQNNDYNAERNRQKHQTELEMLKKKQSEANQSAQKIRQQLIELNQEFDSFIIQTINRLEVDLTKVNDLFLQSHVENRLSKLSREEKICYLNNKIHEIRQKNKYLQNENITLQNSFKLKSNTLEDLKQGFEKGRRQMNQFQKILKKEFQNQLEFKQKEWKLMLDQAMQQNLEIRNYLQEEFIKLRMLHQQQIQNWEKKYQELTDLFAERPSRMEDLMALKKLMEQKEQLLKAMQATQLKMKQANDIVKYLKLELENYKEVYNIFGPESTTNNDLQMIQFDGDIKKKQNSFFTEQFNHKRSSPNRRLTKYHAKTQSIQDVDNNTNNDNTDYNESTQKNTPLPQLKKYMISTDLTNNLTSINFNRIQESTYEILQNADKFISELKKNDDIGGAPTPNSKNYIKRKIRISSTKGKTPSNSKKKDNSCSNSLEKKT